MHDITLTIMLRSLVLVANRSCRLTGNSVRNLATVGSGLKDDTPITTQGKLLVAGARSEFSYVNGTVIMKDAEGSLWKYPVTTEMSYAYNHLDAAKRSPVLIDQNGVKATITTLPVGSRISRVVMVGRNEAIDADFNEQIMNAMMKSIRKGTFDPSKSYLSLLPSGERDVSYLTGDGFWGKKGQTGMLSATLRHYNSLSEDDRKGTLVILGLVATFIMCYIDSSNSPPSPDY